MRASRSMKLRKPRNRSQLSSDGGQHFKERRAVGGSQHFIETCFVLGGDELLRAGQHRTALIRQDNNVGAAIIGRTYPRAQFAALQAIERRPLISSRASS